MSAVISKWLARQYDANMLSFVLCAVTKGGGERELESFDAATDEANPEHWEQLAEDVTARAYQEQSLSRGKLKFVLLAKLADDKTSKMDFAVNRGKEAIKRDAPTEALLHQVYRHNEQLLAAVLSDRKEFTNLLKAQLIETAKIVERSQQSVRDLLAENEKLASRQEERRLREMEVQSKLAIKEEMANKFFQLAPAVVNKIAGTTVLKEDASTQQIVIAEFMSSLSDEQKVKIMSALTPEQQIALGGLVQRETP